MKRPSFSLILSGIFIAYVLHSIYGIAQLFLPPTCTPIGTFSPTSRPQHCLNSFLSHKPKLQLILATTTKSKLKYFQDLELIGQWKLPKLRRGNLDEIGVGDTIFRDNISIPIHRTTRNNGSLYIHAFLAEDPRDPSDPGHNNWIHLIQQQTTMTSSFQLTEYLVPEATTFNLLNSGSGDKGSNSSTSSSDQNSRSSQSTQSTKSSKSAPIAHLIKKIRVALLTQPYSLPTQNIPEDLYYLIRIVKSDLYLPPFRFDKLSSRLRDYYPINSTDETVEVELEFEAESIGKLRLGAQFEQAMESMRTLGFQPKDLDEVKAIFSDTNVWLLGLTFFVASVHLLFDFLAFKNDVNYWRSRKTVVGLSSRTILWRCFSQIVIFLYLLEEKSSLLITIPGGIGVIIETWKVTKAYKLRVSFPNGPLSIPRLSFGTMSESEKATARFDGESMKYLSYLMYPLLLGGAGYSLLYTPHKSWYSWTLQSLVNGVYAFGFLFMLPQLFVNYRLKSVAHLPWRAFMYKAFNTFIDDLFAFIITMPVAHRMACFRDDIVFLIYLYQRWLYPVDKTRLDAGGEYELELEDSEKSKDAGADAAIAAGKSPKKLEDKKRK